MTVDVGADELRIRELLRSRGVGPDAASTITTPPDTAPGEPAAPAEEPHDDQVDVEAAAPAEEPHDDQADVEAAAPAEEPHDDQADVEPAAPEKADPATAPNRTPRIPPWWAPKSANWWQIDGSAGAPPATARPEPDKQDPDDRDTRDGGEPPAPTQANGPRKGPTAATTDVEHDEDEDDEDHEPEAPRPAARWRMPRRAPAAPRTARVRARTSDPEKGNDRLRVIGFLGAAAALGASLGLVDLFSQVLPYAERSATGIFRTALVLAGAVAAWYITALPAVRYVLVYPWLRAVIVLGAAEAGRQLAPVPVAWINEHGGPYQLAAPEASLLLTVAVMCGGLYWALDRRAVHLHWTARLIVAVPFASALVAVLLYEPGTTH
ncbi:hypothetical protein [Streptomyces sp. DH12]|uniref:hypothetical protein n=1 Tax=Streptomyces sp. DH12 TaxID=2857010 RepID=UPI001E2CB52F|nr:hypothetical protein [Streptomyces sp. DH12]